MYGTRRDDTCGSAKFTAHAAAQLQRRQAVSAFGRANRTPLDDPSPRDAEQLKRIVRQTFPNCNIDHIHRVNIPQMFGMYLLRKEEMQLANGGNGGKEQLLYHVTTKSRALESLDRGLDWRRTKRSKFGCGVSFSDDADYANYYANHSTHEVVRVIIVCAVMVKNTHQVMGKQNEGYNMTVPPRHVDTTMSPNRRVYVKYNDYDFYPLYFVYYQRSLKHLNESKYFNAKHKLPKWEQDESGQQLQREQAQRRLQQEEQAQRRLQQEEQAQKRILQDLAQRQRQRDLAQFQRNQEQAQRQRQARREMLEQANRAHHQPRRQSKNESSCLIL